MAGKTLYEPSFEHDSCGIGAVVSIDGIKSHSVVDNALSIVEKLEHRAGKDASGKTGDGVGILLQTSHTFFCEALKKGEISSSAGKIKELGGERDYGVGMFFFPQENLARLKDIKLFENLCKKENLELMGWREVPLDADVLGEKARECMPFIMQCFIKRPSDCEKGLAFDRRLYILRKQFEKIQLQTYVCSLSSRTIVYKGMFLVNDLRLFYKDLQSPLFTSSLAIVHSLPGSAPIRTD